MHLCFFCLFLNSSLALVVHFLLSSYLFKAHVLSLSWHKYCFVLPLTLRSVPISSTRLLIFRIKFPSLNMMTIDFARKEIKCFILWFGYIFVLSILLNKKKKNHFWKLMHNKIGYTLLLFLVSLFSLDTHFLHSFNFFSPCMHIITLLQSLEQFSAIAITEREKKRSLQIKHTENVIFAC